MWKTTTTAHSTSDLSSKHQTSEISLKTSEVTTLVITMHAKFLKSVPASRTRRSAHICEKQICLRIQQRQSNAKWFQSLSLPPSGFFNSKNSEGFCNISGLHVTAW